MKRIISVFLIMLLLSTIHVSAAGSVSFSSDSIECKSNRLIEVNFNAECGKKLRAATFEFSFDKSILEFRGIGTPSGTIVEYNEKSNSIKLSYLCKDGSDISSKAAIFTLKFKSINEGYTDISYTVFDCVDSDVQQMPVGSCTSGRVTVSGKAPDNIGTVEMSGSPTEKNTKSTSSPSKSSKSSKSVSSSETGSTTHSRNNSPATFDSAIQRDYDKITPIIVLCASAVICIAFIGFLLFKISVIRKSQNKKDDK